MFASAEKIVINELKIRGEITSEKLSKMLDVSRQYAHKILSKMVSEKKLIKVGGTKSAHYVMYTKKGAEKIKTSLEPISSRLKNKGIQEDIVFDGMEKKGGLFKKISNNTKSILRYAFTEMLNNAIDHSKSTNIDINFFLDNQCVFFEVNDYGIGIYNNIRGKYKLKDDYEAIQEILKGKRTTAPKKHSGEGIFFTSKIADVFSIESSKLKLVIDNEIGDIAIDEIGKAKNGTKVTFKINMHSKKNLKAIFNEFTDENFKFSKTSVIVKLYEKGVDYVSRSQGRRILYGLEKFDTVIMDFKNISGIGQGFADEVFRVFKIEHPRVEILPKNANSAVMFMIKRAQSSL